MLEPHIAPPACVTEDAFAALMEISKRPPVVFVEGRGSWLTDQEGKKYLDFIQGWAVNCLGHCPTAIVSAIKSQAEQLLNCSPAYYNAPMIRLAELIGSRSGGSAPAAKRMIERSMERFDLYPARVMGDSAYGSAEMLGWLVHEHGIEPHVTVFDKSARQDGTFSRDHFTYDHVRDFYLCPGGKKLTTTGTLVNDNATMLYRARKHDCEGCALKLKCCPSTPAR